MTDRARTILLVNPNTTRSMTDKMVAAGRAVLATGTTLVGVTAAEGAPSIEGYYDEVFAVPPLLRAIAEQAQGADGIVVGCFDDTGVDAARCLVDVPVVGICQAAMQAATVVAGSFSVVTTLARSVPALERLCVHYGFERACKGVWASEIPVLALEDPLSDATEQLRAQIARTLEADGPEAVVLGCAGMSDLAKRFSDEFGVPVLEGVGCAVKLVEGLACLGVKTSKGGGYARPGAKAFSGRFEVDSPS